MMNEGPKKSTSRVLNTLSPRSPRLDNDTQSLSIQKTIAAPMPLLKCSQHSLKPDMFFGWRPKQGRIIFADNNDKKETKKTKRK